MRILGIDCGSYSIKALEVDSAFGRYEIHEYHELRIENGETVNQAAQRLLQSITKKPDKIAIALKTGHVTFRNLRLPTRDKKAIDAGVRFELDDDLPFSIENAAFDYSIISQNKQGSMIHAAAALATHVGQTLEGWLQSGIDPDLITTEAWAYRAFLNRTNAPEARKKPTMVIQIGHEKTVVLVFREGMPIIAREIGWGGRDLTQAICEKYGVPFDQAEHAKLDHGFVIPGGQSADATAEQIEFSNTLLGPVQLLIAELRQAELTCKNLTNENIETVHLSGGTSLLPGLNRVIEEHLRTPVKHVSSLTALASPGVNYNEETDASFLLAASLTLCMVGPDRGTSVNFRKGAFSRASKNREFNWATLQGPILATAAVCLCFFVSIIVQSHVYEGRLRDTNTALERSVKSFFGGQLSSSAVKTYLSNTKTLKSSINKELDKQRDVAKLMGPNPHPPLGFLRELSATIPRDVVVDMTEFQVGAAPASSFLDAKADANSSASLTFLTQNPQAVDRLASLLGGKISALTHTPPESTTTLEGESRWKVSFTGKPTEDSYGK